MRKLLREIKYHHLVPLFAFLSLILATAGIVLYWQSPYLGENSVLLFLLLLFLMAVLIWGIFLVIATRVSHRDGFWMATGMAKVMATKTGKKTGRNLKIESFYSRF